MCDDMEKSCDEAVLREMNNRGYSMKSIKKAYGNMLLVLGGGKQHIFSPVSFAENSTKSRVKNVVAYNRIARNMGVGLAVVCVLVALLCIVNPTRAAAVSVVTGTDVVSASDEQENDTPAVEITIGDVTFMSDVTELDLSGQELDDISALAQCTRLETLNLSETYITDITVLPQIPTLKHLNLSGNTVFNYNDELYDLNDYLLPSFSDWTPLSRCTGLLSLDMSDCIFADLSFLHSLTELRELDISGGNINFGDSITNDISVLAQCTKLESLNLSRLQVDDISVLAQCTQLRTLNLSESSVSDISSLAQCTRLESLNLSGIRITDISVLSQLPELQVLYLEGHNGIRDENSIRRPDFGWSQLNGMTQLTELYLQNSYIPDYSFIENMDNLQILDISDSLSLRFLEEKNNLRELYCGSLTLDEESKTEYSHPGLYNLEVLVLENGLEQDIVETVYNFVSGCYKMRYLDIRWCDYLYEIDYSNMISLEYLNISYITPEQCRTIARVAQLKELYTELMGDVGYTSNELFEALCENRQLESVTIRNSTNLTDISPIANLERIKKLGIRNEHGIFGGTQIQDISALSGLTELQYLDLCGNVKLSDISPLSSIKNLIYLELEGCAVEDISVLSNLKNLQYLNLNGCAVSDITALASMEELTDVHLAGNNISDVSCLFGHKGLSDGYYYDDYSETIAGPGGRLVIYENPLTDEQLVELFESLKKQCRIEWNDLSLF